jgi:hypothetical protein
VRAAFEHVECVLHAAREQTLFNDIPNLERTLRYLRLIAQHALRIFQQCRKELQPLYESLRRSIFIAQGAALALDRLQRDGVAKWGADPLTRRGRNQGVLMKWEHECESSCQPRIEVQAFGPLR